MGIISFISSSLVLNTIGSNGPLNSSVMYCEYLPPHDIFAARNALNSKSPLNAIL